jgi:hypothetical protein
MATLSAEATGEIRGGELVVIAVPTSPSIGLMGLTGLTDRCSSEMGEWMRSALLPKGLALWLLELDIGGFIALPVRARVVF